MLENRKPTREEFLLIKHLVELIQDNDMDIETELRAILVRPMQDGGMGSLEIFPFGELIEKRTFGKKASEFSFLDKDGVTVLASLNLDSNGHLYELDIWKTDFSPIIEFPAL